MQTARNYASLSIFLPLLLLSLLPAASFLPGAMAQQAPSSLLLQAEQNPLPASPPIMPETLSLLGATPSPGEKPLRQNQVNGIYDFTPMGYGQEGGFAINFGRVHAAGFSGLSNLAGLSPCFTNATQCGQYGQNAHQTAASALGYWDQKYGTPLDYSLNLLNGLLPGGHNWNQFQGQYPVPGGQGPENYDTGGQSYADAIYSQAYSPQIQALLGYNPSSSYNFTTQFVNFTSSLFSPTAEWNTSFSIFPTLSTSLAGRRMVADQGTAAESLAVRYAAVAQQQLATHYTDPNLLVLRQEASLVQTGLLLQNPYYVYNSYLLNNYLTQIYSLSPSYGDLVNLTGEIAGWTTPPADSALLTERYFKRYLLNYFQARVQYDGLAYLYTHPQDQQLLTLHANLASQAAGSVFNLPVVLNWYSDWNQRYQAAQISSSTVDELMTDLLADYPAFAAYMDLLQKVRALTNQVGDRPAVQEATSLVQAMQNDQEFHNTLAQQYQAYQNRVSELLGQTRFIAEMERYYENLNGLLLQDPAYVALQQRYQANAQALQAYQHEMATAVYNCQLQYGSSCNAYFDPTVIGLLQSGRFSQVAADLAAFNEDYSTFWYLFYQGETYRTLETASQQAIATAIARVTPQLQAAREEYQLAIDAMPQRQAVQAAMLAVANDLRTLYLPDSSMTVGQALEQMAQLAASLEEAPGSAPPLAGSDTFTLRGSYPNPFQSSSTIALELTEPGQVRVEVYDLFGRQVLASPTRKLNKGSREIEVDGSALVSGMYVYKVFVQTPTATQVKGGRMTVLK